MRKFFKRFIITLLLLGAIGAAIIVAFNAWLHAAYASRIYTSIDDLAPNDNAAPRIAIVFGAGLTRSGEPTAGVVRSRGDCGRVCINAGWSTNCSSAAIIASIITTNRKRCAARP